MNINQPGDLLELVGAFLGDSFEILGENMGKYLRFCWRLFKVDFHVEDSAPLGINFTWGKALDARKYLKELLRVVRGLKWDQKGLFPGRAIQSKG